MSFLGELRTLAREGETQRRIMQDAELADAADSLLVSFKDECRVVALSGREELESYSWQYFSANEGSFTELWAHDRDFQQRLVDGVSAGLAAAFGPEAEASCEIVPRNGQYGLSIRASWREPSSQPPNQAGHTSQSAGSSSELSNFQEPIEEPPPIGLLMPPANELLPIGLLFPGWESHYAGMLYYEKDKPAVRSLFAKALSVLDFDLLHACLNGPESELNRFDVCLPAVFVASLAAVEKLRQEREEAVTHCQAMAGFGLGQYAALCAADVISVEDGLRLLKVMGQACREAAGLCRQAVLQVTGFEKPRLAVLCSQAAARHGHDVCCRIALEIGPSRFRVSGHEAAVLSLKDLADWAGASEARILETPLAYHTPLMARVQERLCAELDYARPRMRPPRCTVYLNSGSPVKPRSSPDAIVEHLKVQLTSAVLWETSVQAMVGESIREFYEVGPRKRLKGLMKHINDSAWCSTTNVEV